MKILVAHPAQQHSYRLATALKRIKMLDKYATTVYYKKGNFTYVISKVLKGNFKKKAEGRHCDELSDDEVIQFCELEGLLKLVALNTKYLKNSYNKIKYNTADRFAKKVAHYAIKNNVDAVITYDDSSPLLFEILKEKAPNILRIMDMSAANILYMKEIYEKDLKLAPNFANRLKSERSICWDEEITGRALREIRATQKFLVPSEFVAKSLRYSGVKSEQMYRCPYGVDVSDFSLKDYPTKNIIRKRTIKFIYVGGVKELKGISYLLDAFTEISQTDAVLTVVGQYDPEEPDIIKYKNIVNFTGPLLHTQIPDILRKSDVFIFPSLGDSYALSVMEAAACGLPIIVSNNTGVQDLVQDGIDGFIVPIQSKEALLNKIHYFIDNPGKIEPMGRAARKMAEENSWDKYYENISEIATNLLGGVSQPTIKDYSMKNYDDKFFCHRPIHFIYVGGVKELKGISYLLEAFQEIPSNIADLTVVGNYDPSDEDVRPFKKKINFIGSVLHTQVANELKKADIYVFASLGEGLSLSTLEAAACGLPLIVTENSGINDEMTDGVEGFVIPIQSKNAIVDRVLWFSKHPEKIEQMGKAARKMAQRFSWDSYYSCAGEIFKQLDMTYSE